MYDSILQLEHHPAQYGPPGSPTAPGSRGLVLLLSLGLCLLLAGPLRAQPSARAELDTNAMLIGEPVELRLRVRPPTGSVVHWPSFPGDTIGAFEILDTTAVDTAPATAQGGKALVRSYTLTTFDTGLVSVPEIPVGLQQGQRTDTLSTRLLLMKVRLMPVDTTQVIKPIKDPMNAPLTLAEVLPYILGGVAVAVLVGLAIWYWRRRRKRPRPAVVAAPEPDIPPDVWAREQLEALEARKRWQEGHVKAYYSELTEIIRTYLERRYQIAALESTTEHILEDLLRQPVPAEQRQQLKHMLELADLVKFAKMQPLPDDHHRCLQDAFAFVEATRPVGDPTPQ